MQLEPTLKGYMWELEGAVKIPSLFVYSFHGAPNPKP
jgi:hypothetical protein